MFTIASLVCFKWNNSGALQIEEKVALPAVRLVVSVFCNINGEPWSRTRLKNMLEGYITPLLMSYVDKYVKNIKPSDLKLSFWGGDAVLRNLELRLDVLERELGIPLEFKSGCIRELTLHLPWNAIGSSPVEVTIKDLEFVVKLKPLRATSSPTPASEKGSEERTDSSLQQGSAATGDEKEVAPGYLQGYLNRIINNVCIHVQNMVVKIVEEESDFMLTLNIGSVEFHTVNAKWEKEFVYTDYFQDGYTLYKMLKVSDTVVNLHPIEMTEKAQGSLLHEPFVNRCTIECRMKFEYQGKVVVTRIFEFLIDVMEMSVDERQFCLFLHFSDWLLAMYYFFKKLKGRDENPYSGSGLQDQGRGEIQGQAGSSHQGVADADSGGTTSYSDIFESELKAGPGNGSGNGTGVGQAGNGSHSTQDSDGWGAWLLSYVGPSESEKDISVSESRDSQEEEEIKAKQPKQARTRFAITANSVTVTLKMTQHIQVPVFTRLFTSPVLRVIFTSCMFRLDKCPLTKLFLMCVGIGGVRCEVMGLCPCVNKFPSSWRRTSVASATDTSKVVSMCVSGVLCVSCVLCVGASPIVMLCVHVCMCTLPYICGLSLPSMVRSSVGHSDY